MSGPLPTSCSRSDHVQMDICIDFLPFQQRLRADRQFESLEASDHSRSLIYMIEAQNEHRMFKPALVGSGGSSLIRFTN